MILPKTKIICLYQSVACIHLYIIIDMGLQRGQNTYTSYSIDTQWYAFSTGQNPATRRTKQCITAQTQCDISSHSRGNPK